MLIHICIFLILLWYLDYYRFIRAKKKASTSSSPPKKELDEDVLLEQEKALKLSPEQDPVVVQQITKEFPLMQKKFNLLSCLNGHFSPTKTVVDNVSFSIHSGECFGLLGPNGAGKTTLLSMLTSEIPPSSGKLIFSKNSNLIFFTLFRGCIFRKQKCSF